MVYPVRRANTTNAAPTSISGSQGTMGRWDLWPLDPDAACTPFSAQGRRTDPHTQYEAKEPEDGDYGSLVQAAGPRIYTLCGKPLSGTETAG